MIRFLVPLLLLISPLHGLDWVWQSVASGPEAGTRCAVAVDPAGRIHTVHTTVSSGTTTLTYSMRPNRGSGFSAVQTLLSSTLSVAHLDLDVGTDYTVQAAAVLGNGDVVVYERTSGGVLSIHTVAVAGGSTAATGGVSIVASGNGFSRPSLAFTATDGSARFTDKTSVWAAPVAVTTGANTGFAPSLTDTYGGLVVPTTTPRAIFTYSDTLKRVQVSYYSLISSSWQAPVNVAPCPAATRPSVDVHLGKLGVAYSFTDSSGETPVRAIRYADNASGSWTVQTITAADEMESEFDFFSSNLEMSFDATGEPLVGYKRDVFVIFDAFTRDIRFRRRVPAIGWEMTVVKELGSDFCGDLDLATNGAGDPAFVFEDDTNTTDSNFTFARPWAQPVTTDTSAALDASYQHSFAPALALNPKGEVMLLASVATQADLFSERVYRTPKIVTERHGPDLVTDVGTTDGPHFANALVTTASGLTYFVTLQGALTFDTSGEIHYGQHFGSAANATAPVGAVVSGVFQRQRAKRAPLRLASDATDRLYLTFTAEDGTGRLITRTPPEPPPGLETIRRQWYPLDIIPGDPTGIDLAVRADGAYAISYVDPGVRIVKLRTNINVANGAKLLAPVTVNVLTLGAGGTLPLNTACVIPSSGVPHVLTGQGNLIKDLRFNSSGAVLSQNLPFDCPGATVRAVASGNRIDVCAHSTRDGGSLHHTRFFDGVATTPQTQGRFVNTRGGMGSLGPDLAMVLDANGFPVIASSHLSGGFPLLTFFDDVLISRKADSLDDDGDGVPLLAENAHAMARFMADASLKPRMETFTYNSGGLQLEMGARYRHPKVPLTSGATGVSLFGEFRYQIAYSSDLQTFAVPPAGFFINTVTDPDPQVQVGQRLVTVWATPAQRVAHPRGFVRLDVSRDR
ncbi:hypothetical protein OJ996_15070 [Luteolibacter sp. GHJ8]|uniref:Fibronectin type-III domain-containing protein n=1 Tax=Luteolibacter rhizosphaerae TaxID=2989719 RepID=A0ABT3G4Z8_9BACT|nr:hypothetical protein [Luteolibacter rhizosphaerae]MCW1914908.1 hypothetical protein [Luteolibacter rhizosphaerae]